MGVSLDLTINLGHILTVIGGVIIGYGVVMAQRRDIDLIAQKQENVEKVVERVEAEITGVKNEMKTLTDVLVNQGRYEERQKAQDDRLREQGDRLSNLAAMISDLRRGKGIITED